MPFLSKMPRSGKVFDAFETWPDTFGHFVPVSQAILRDARSSLTAGEREVIGTFVSRLNQCNYCSKVHNSAVGAFGFPADLVECLLEDIDSAPVSEKLKPILRFVRKLTLDQTRMVQRDADAVLNAGWDQDDLALAVAICSLFNFMNRMVHGLGIEEDPQYTLGAGARLKERGYSGSSRLSKEQRDVYTSPGEEPQA